MLFGPGRPGYLPTMPLLISGLDNLCPPHPSNLIMSPPGAWIVL